MKGGSCSSCLPQMGGACPCQAKTLGGSRTHKKSHKKTRSNKYAMLCTCKLKRLRTRKHKKYSKNRK